MALVYQCRRLAPLVAEAAKKESELVERLTWDFAGLSASAVLGEELRKSVSTLSPAVHIGNVWALRRAAVSKTDPNPSVLLLLSMEGPEVGPQGETGRPRLHSPESLHEAANNALLEAGEVALHSHIAQRGALKDARGSLAPELSLIEERVLSAVLEGQTKPAIASEIGFSEAMVRATQRSLADKLKMPVPTFEELDDDGGLAALRELAFACAKEGDFLLGWYTLLET